MPSSSPTLNIALWGVPYAGGAEPEQPPATLTEVATANNATNLWLADTGYSINGSDVATWEDQIGSVDLVSDAGDSPVQTTESGVTILDFPLAGDYLRAVTSVSATRFQYLLLMKPSQAVSSTAFKSNQSNFDAKISLRSAGDRYGVSSATTLTAAIDVNQWELIYCDVANDAMTWTVKVGVNAAQSFTSAALNLSPSNDPDAIVIGAKGNGSNGAQMRAAAMAYHVTGGWSAANVNAIAAKIIEDYAALSPDWSAIS